MVTGLLLLIACLAPAGVLWLVFNGPRLVSRACEATRAQLRRRRPVLPPPAGPPLERLAADLRRLRHQSGDASRSRTQRHAARLAYEDVLRAAAAALDVRHDLNASCAGLARELEMLRLEQALVDAGLVLTPA